MSPRHWAAPAQPDPVRARFDAALALAHRALADRDNPEPEDQGRRVVDPDARRGKPGAYFDGYLLDVLGVRLFREGGCVMFSASHCCRVFLLC
jgi:hypothetical protein